jgi:hypothetical protein
MDCGKPRGQQPIEASHCEKAIPESRATPGLLCSARNDENRRFDESGFLEFTIGHFRSLRTQWRGVICAFGSREEFCDRNTFDHPPILTGLRGSAERKPPLGAKGKQ